MTKGQDAIKYVQRWILDNTPNFDEFVPLHQKVWLNKQTCCRKYHLRGVPAAWITFLVDERWGADIDERDIWCVEFVSKRGRFDGKERPQIVLRVLPGHTCRNYGSATLSIERFDKNTRVSLDTWAVTFDRLREELDDYNLEQLYWWHWTRYFRIPIPRRDAEERLADWLADFQLTEPMGLAEANRHVNRWLYQLARELGWRKLTLREQQKLNVTGPWYREVRTGLID